MPKTAAKTTENRPFDEIRNRNLRATIWKNQADGSTIYNVTLSRTWKDEQGQYHDSSSFSFGDLMNLAKLLMDAHTTINIAIGRERNERAGSKPSDRS